MGPVCPNFQLPRTGQYSVAVDILYRGLALTRQQIRNIIPTDLDVAPRQIRVRGHLLTSTEAPGECMACAVTRWLRLLNLAEQRDWATVRRSMAGRWTERAGEQDLHDSTTPPRGVAADAGAAAPG